LCTSFQVEVTADSGLYGGAEEIIRWLREEAGLPVGLIRNSKLDEQAMRKRIAKGNRSRFLCAVRQAHNLPPFLHPAGIDPGHFEAVVMGGEVGCVAITWLVHVSAAFDSLTLGNLTVRQLCQTRCRGLRHRSADGQHRAHPRAWRSTLRSTCSFW
jgi:hypothetical protein